MLHAPRRECVRERRDLGVDAALNSCRRCAAALPWDVLDLVRERALQVCNRSESALWRCAKFCGTRAALIAFHQWWSIATRPDCNNGEAFFVELQIETLNGRGSVIDQV